MADLVHTRARTRPTFLVAIVFVALWGGGCCHHEQQLPPPVPLIPSVPAPTAAQIAAKYNARVKRLERFSATAEVQVKGTDAAGVKVDESFDGVLKVERPAHLSMRGHKAGVDAFILGSSDTQYWWIDLYNKPITARVGSHDAVGYGPGASKFELPLHPLDFIELLAITPIYIDARTPPTTRWLGYGSVELVDHVRFGTRKIAVAYPSFEPIEVTLLDREGRETAHAVLKEIQAVDVAGDAAAAASAPTRLFVNLKSPSLGDLILTIKLYSLENKDINPRLFDLRDLRERFGVEKEVSLDGPPARADAK